MLPPLDSTFWRAPDQAIVDALVRASRDRAFLASLVASGRAQRSDGEYERRHPDVAKPFVHVITSMLPRRTGSDTIRPNKKRQKKGRK